MFGPVAFGSHERTAPGEESAAKNFSDATAVEIDSAYKIPHMPFLRMAKAAGLRFSFGSNTGSGPERAIDFCVETAKQLGLRPSDLFIPAPRARKPIMRRKMAA